MNAPNQTPLGMPAEHQGYRDAAQYRRRLLGSVWPYVVVVMLVFGISVLAAQDPTWPLFAAGWLVAAGCVAVAYLHPQLWMVAPFGAVGSVLLIRWGTDGLASGVGPLLLVPVFAVALYGSRRTLAAMLLFTGLVVVGVHLGTTESRVTLTTVWRQDVIMLTLAVVLGVAVNGLVNRLRAERRLSQSREASLEQVSEITRAIATSSEPAQALCRKAVELSGAGGAALFRWQQGEPELLAWENADPKELRRLAAGPIRETLSGSGVDGKASLRIWHEGSQELGQHRPAWLSVEPTAMVSAPVHLGENLAGLLILTWPAGTRPEDSSIPLELLAAEAAISIRNHELTEQLERLALTDPLTGVANRRGWEQQIASSLGVAGRHRRPISLAVLDLDGFKAYNDRHGHQAGDLLLLESVARWRQAVRSGDQIARYGGDEFLVTLPETGLEDARVVIERICQSTDRSVDCSAGIAEWDGSESAAALLGRADSGLYLAKAEGPGSVRTAGPAESQPGR